MDREYWRCPTCGADGAAYVCRADVWRYACTARKGHPTWSVEHED